MCNFLPPWTKLPLPTVRYFHLCITKVTKTQEKHTVEASLGYHCEFEANLVLMAKSCLENKIKLNMDQRRDVDVHVV